MTLSDGTSVWSKHPPGSGIVQFFGSREQAADAGSSIGNFVTGTLSAYLDLLNRYLAANIALSVKADAAPVPLESALEVARVQPHHWDHRLGREAVEFSAHLKGRPTQDIKAQEEQLAVGGLRDTAKSVNKLHHSSSTGKSNRTGYPQCFVDEPGRDASGGHQGTRMVQCYCQHDRQAAA